MESSGLEATVDTSLVGLFLEAGLVVKIVMIGLILASVWCWAIMFDRWRIFSKTRKQMDQFEDVFWSGQNLEELYRTLSQKNPQGMAALFVAAMGEWKRSFERNARSPIGLQTRIDKTLDVALAREMERLEKQLPFLATLGSAAPFVGLFGTVVGIMTSFQAIAGSKS
ncbi:MAG: MotA/TolQ/ExbB proton channel family protein, partial [Pseudomonadota bacterium]